MDMAATPPKAEDNINPYGNNPALQPGTPWGDAAIRNRQIEADQHVPLRQRIADGFKSTAAFAVGRNVSQRTEGFDPLGALVAGTGQAGKWGTADWDKSKYYDELTAGLSEEHKDAVMQQTTLAGARLTRGNIQDDLSRMDRMGLTRGVGQVFQMAGMLADVDLPLVLVSGGGFGIAKSAGRAAFAGRNLRAVGATAGVKSGLQAGVAVDALDAANRDTTTWMDAVRSVMLTTAMGGAIGAAAPSLMLPMKEIAADFVNRVRTGDPAIWDDPPMSRPMDANSGRAVIDDTEDFAPGDEPAVAEATKETPDDMSIGAAAVTARSNMRAPTAQVVDIGGVPVTNKQYQWIEHARNWVFNSGYKDRYARAMESAVNRVFSTPWLNPGTNNVMRMVKSGSSVANWLAGTVYEVASGVVRGDTSTAAILQRQYQGRLGRYLNNEQSILGAWAKANGKATMDPTGNFVVRVKPEGYREFYRRVRLDIDAEDAIRNGAAVARDTDPHVRQMADQFIAANEDAGMILRGRPGESSVRGFENFQKGVAYSPYSWHAPTFLGALARKDAAGNPLLTQDMLIDGFTNAYMAKGTFSDPAIARQVAKAVVERFTARGKGQDESIVSLFTKDGRDYIENTLKGNGTMSDEEIAGFMRRFDNQIEDRGKLGFAKSRSEIDLNTTITLRDGSEMKIVDFMDPDFSATQQRYLRQVAGHSALARKGITHRGMRGEIISAMRAEQRSLGEDEMEAELLDAMFSEFDGSAQIGYAMGQSNAGIGAAAELKSLSSLSVLQLNGFAQAAETGVGMFAVGLNNWFTRGIKPIFDKAIKDGNAEVFRELAFFIGQIGKDQHTFRPHMVLDETTDYRANNKFTKGLSRARGAIAHGNYIQGYTSGLNAVREFQQKVAWLGMSDKILRTIKSEIDGLGPSAAWSFEGRMYRDLGLTNNHYNELRNLIETGVIQFGTTKGLGGEDMLFVNRLNLDQWDGDLAQDFVSALARNEAQLVQRPLAGETDRWMHTTLGALLTHLQTFPILAIQKQGARHAGQADMQAMAQTLGGISSAYVAISMRDMLTGREREGTEQAKAAFAYANITGWVPMYSDPIMSALGMHDYRINGFGAYAEPLSTPAFDIANRLYRAPGAAVNAMQGETSSGDRQALKAIPFVNLIDTLTGLMGANLLSDPKRETGTERLAEYLRSSPPWSAHE